MKIKPEVLSQQLKRQSHKITSILVVGNLDWIAEQE